MLKARKPKCSDIPDVLILRLCRDFHARVGPTPEIALADRFPEKLVLAKMDKLDDRGLIDFGVSLRTAWPTEKGLELLATSAQSTKIPPG